MNVSGKTTLSQIEQPECLREEVKESRLGKRYNKLERSSGIIYGAADIYGPGSTAKEQTKDIEKQDFL